MRAPRIVGSIVLGATLLLAGCGKSVEVKAVKVAKGSVRESFSEPARTRLENKYLVAMPVSAQVAHLDLDAGDVVKKGQVLVPVDKLPLEKSVGEVRAAVAELEARVKILADDSVEKSQLASAESGLAATRTQLEGTGSALKAQEARTSWAAREALRFADLTKQKAVSASAQEAQQVQADTAVLDADRLRQESAKMASMVRNAEEAVETQRRLIARRQLERAAAEQQLAQARERLTSVEHDLELANIVSPIDGVVLEKYERGGGPLTAGQKVFLLGNMDALEVEADALTQDAVRLHAGSPVEYTLGPGLAPLKGEVIRVEPSGFVKLSSLGVEQQRVRVISSLAERPATLGVEYRLQARYETGAKDGVLLVPRYSVLQAPDESYYVFTIDGALARKKPVKLGLKSDYTVEITEGVTEGSLIVATPDTTLVDGAKVKAAGE